MNSPADRLSTKLDPTSDAGPDKLIVYTILEFQARLGAHAVIGTPCDGGVAGVLHGWASQGGIDPGCR